MTKRPFVTLGKGSSVVITVHVPHSTVGSRSNTSVHVLTLPVIAKLGVKFNTTWACVVELEASETSASLS